MGELLSGFAHAFAGSAPLAMAAAVAWGALSVALSPCHLASIPLVVGYLWSAEEAPAPRQALRISGAFAVGILASVAAVGVATALAGRMLGDVGPAGSYLLAAVFIAMGLHLAGLLPLPQVRFAPASFRRKGPAGAALLGLVFGMALGPCSFAFMAPLLALTFRLGAAAGAYGALLLALFGIGHAAAIAFAGAAGGSVQTYLRWSERSRWTARARRGAGAAVAAVGAYFLWSA
ncbi:cytochrome c biogenesis CcdA family protein [Anaeromyxobacter diazotrophicus]|uniref:Cytochrome C biogenesis protein CcdA n=1 Tax=Anaeromyxobacter diazotrophicus TaxID=2590199 RepID=A0A7I9VL56_9BACT|nr:cytochrome c biogenesis protein CcdA [Anaeromyxobacter diazotrophicus]GEJ57142.1 cytochrome C biogenesis protein CcdA [Anaeromyxobacter diazotrophicus]